MFSGSNGIALWLAVGITALVLAILSLLPEATPTLLATGGAAIFAASYLLISIALHFFIFEEISTIHKVLEKIQKKNPGLIETRKRGRTLQPLRNLQGTIDAFATAKNREIEILQKNEAFRRQFIADISHELKTPIFAAQGYIHTLLDGAVEDLTVRDKFLDRAAKSMNNLENLVQDLITLNQMESGVVKFTMTEFDLKETVQEILDQLEDKANRRNVSITLVANPEANYHTLADRDKIFRVIQNLVSNAIKYNKDGGTVTVQLKSGKNRIRVKVKDEGRGIPPEDLKRIFERFYRVEKSRSREQGGTGLGLAIVKHILEGHKTKIFVTSTVDEGSVFSFYLPHAYKKKENSSSKRQPN